MAGLGHTAKGYLFIFLIVVLLVGLPIAVWLDLSNLVEANLRRQANDVNSIITSMRHYYANNVVGRILASPGTTKVVHNYKDYPGAIPIPATLSLELGKVVGEQQKNIKYRFVSDYPFKDRTPHAFDEFETDALNRLRSLSTKISRYLSPQIYGSIFSGQKDVTIHTERKKLTIFFLGHSGFYRNYRASSARTNYAAPQRLFYRDVENRPRSWWHHRQVHW
jgi:hypothetical protein